MQKLVDEINLIIENEKLEDVHVCTYLSLNVSIKASEINKKQNIEESFKNYILENDCNVSYDGKIIEYNTTKEELDEYAIEEIKYWADDLYITLDFLPRIGNERSFKVSKLINKLQENKVKAYRLINPTINDGRVHEYEYVGNFILGSIRCYETDNERFIISFTGCD